jgi:hypothetical protein
VRALLRRPVAALRGVGVEPRIDPRPFDLGDSPAFPDDTTHDRYDAGAVERFWRVLRLTDAGLKREAKRASTARRAPIHLFWHSFDLAHARYSGRGAPAIEGADGVTAEAYSREVIAFGWWPGDAKGTPYPAFYS